MNWNTIFESLIVQVLVPFLAIVAIPLLGKMAREYFSKSGKALRIVKAAVKFAETTGLDALGEEKLSLAITFALDALASKGFENVDLNVLISAIEGEVATVLNMSEIIAE